MKLSTAKIFVLFKFLIWVSIIALAGCSEWQDDTTYLTPIPQATIRARTGDMPIRNKLDAAIEAQWFLLHTRMEYEETPIVLSAESITLEEAHQRTRSLRPGEYFYEDRPGNTRVWLVIFEGEWRIVPPVSDYEYTPEPLTHGCAFVIIDPKNERHSMGTRECSFLLEEK